MDEGKEIKIYFGLEFNVAKNCVFNYNNTQCKKQVYNKNYYFDVFIKYQLCRGFTLPS